MHWRDYHPTGKGNQDLETEKSSKVTWKSKAASQQEMGLHQHVTSFEGRVESMSLPSFPNKYRALATCQKLCQDMRFNEEGIGGPCI